VSCQEEVLGGDVSTAFRELASSGPLCARSAFYQEIDVEFVMGEVSVICTIRIMPTSTRS